METGKLRRMVAKGMRFPDAFKPHHAGNWPANWISIADQPGGSFVAAYRLMLSPDRPQAVRVHVTADQRYDLFLDGQRIGRGPERGDVMNWFYETYELRLSAGKHVVVARVWTLDQQAWHAPGAQLSLRHGFLLAGEGELADSLSTGRAPWEGKRLGGYSFGRSPLPGAGFFAGGIVKVDGREYDWGWETGEGEGWSGVKVGYPARDRLQEWGDAGDNHRLLPAMLPAMLDTPRRVGRVLSVMAPAPAEVEDLPFEAESDKGELEAWQGLLDGGGGVTIPAHSRRRVLVDLEQYYCAYPRLTLSGGRDALVRLNWAESLFENQATVAGVRVGDQKGSRDQWVGKYFRGRGDTFIADGGAGRVFDTLWWECGRYVEFQVQTHDQPLTIEAFALHETRYPLVMEGRVALSDERFNSAVPIMWRTLEMCSHETYMDCPYYEQLMYTGDTRLEVLVTYLMTADDRLPRKAITMFGVSDTSDGLTKARYPSHSAQIIPQFALYFVAMLHDYAAWRGGREFVLDFMPRARQALEVFIRRMDRTGLVDWPEGWNWVDWVPSWEHGNPLNNPLRANAVNQWQFCYVMGLAAELERWLDEPELADRLDRIRRRAADRAMELFWDERRGLFADSTDKDRFSEHAQCFAILSGLLPADQQARVLEGLLSAQDLARATIYFQHYLFEVLGRSGHVDAILDRMQLWFGLHELGLKTCLESPEPSRSDCHAWGAHPIYHVCATILGIRPVGLGSDRLVVQPDLGPLQSAQAEMFIAQGRVSADLKRAGDTLQGWIDLPDGVTGEFRYGEVVTKLQPGRNEIGRRRFH